MPITVKKIPTWLASKRHKQSRAQEDGVDNATLVAGTTALQNFYRLAIERQLPAV
jgi:hypothetical protein